MGVGLERSLVEVARHRQVAPQLRHPVGAQEELVRGGARRHVASERTALPRAERQPQRFHDPAGQGVLDVEDIATLDVLGERPSHVPARHLDQLGRDPATVPGGQDGADQHHVDIQVVGDLTQVGLLGGESGRRHRGSHHQRLDAGQRHRDRVGQAGAQEVTIGVGAEQPEGQDRQTGEWSGCRGPSAGPLRRDQGLELGHHGRGVGVALGRVLGERA